MGKKKKVCMFTLYGIKGASARYRIFIYKEKLDKTFATKYFSFWNDKYTEKYINNKSRYILPILLSYIWNSVKRIFQIVFIAAKYDVIIFQKGILPHLNINFLKYLKSKKKIKVIFDVDDAIYLNDKGISDSIAKSVDKIIAGNNNLAMHYKKFCNDVVVIPTVENFKKDEKISCDTFSRKHIGWIGSKSTIDNLDLVVEPINLLVKKHPEVQFYIICNDDYGYCKKIANSHFIRWDIGTYKEHLNDMTVGIMPLKDTAFNRGKCGFKLIQYLNLSKPVIASDVGVNKDIVNNYGFLCNSDGEWFELLEKVLYDPLVYKELTTNINNHFESQFGFETISKSFIKEIIN